VKKFFFSRFKRRLIKKSIIDKIEAKVENLLAETDILRRARDNKFYLIFYSIIYSRLFKVISMTAIISNIIVLGLVKDNSTPLYD